MIVAAKVAVNRLKPTEKTLRDGFMIDLVQSLTLKGIFRAAIIMAPALLGLKVEIGI